MIKTLDKLKLRNNLQNTKVTFFRSVKVANSNVIERVTDRREKRDIMAKCNVASWMGSLDGKGH